MMKFIRLSAPILLFTVSACSSREIPAENSNIRQQDAFTEEDKRIAGLLTVGSVEIDDAASPQYRATLCSFALQAIEERLRGALSDEQRQAFAQAQSIYNRRAEVGASPQDRELLRDEVEAAYPGEGDRARFAMGCLQALA